MFVGDKFYRKKIEQGRVVVTDGRVVVFNRMIRVNLMDNVKHKEKLRRE